MKNEGYVGFGWYKDEKDYLRLVAISDDSAKLSETYEEWRKFAEETFKVLKSQGVNVVKIEVDIDELIKFCNSNNRKIDTKSRAEFINLKTEERFKLM